MYQRREKRMLEGNLSKFLLGGVFFLSMTPAYAVSGKAIEVEKVHSVLSINQDGRTVSGNVVDETGLPVIGVNVKVKGTTIGAITDLDGNFTLKGVPQNAVLVVSYVGYKEQEIKVGTQSQLSIKLQEDTELIDEVVVVGYAAQKKVNLTGSVSSVNMADIAEKRPITNLSSGLAGMASGISVTSSSNVPGNDNASILVRGQGTLNNSAPLIIIDGVESNINTVAPQDVESMTVLKDAASASIYGSRAANGVILITTKKGKQGKINIDYTGYASLQSVGKTVDAVSDYATYMELRNEAYNKDWVEEIFQTAVSTNHNLSLSGGTDKLSFYSSFGYNNNPGIIDNAGYERYSFRSNIEAKPTKWLTLGMKLNGYLSNNEIGSDRIDDVFTYGYASTPGIVLRHPDGRFGGAQAKGEDIQTNNPLAYLYKNEGNKKERNFRA